MIDDDDDEKSSNLCAKSFTELGLSKWIQNTTQQFSIKIPTEIQTKAIPPILKGHNVIAHSKTGTGKCFSKGTKLRLYNGQTINVENIKGDELLMGDDGTQRRVKKDSIIHNRGQLYEIKSKLSTNTQPLIVNQHHILCLQVTLYPQMHHDKSNNIWTIKWYRIKSLNYPHTSSVSELEIHVKHFSSSDDKKEFYAFYNQQISDSKNPNLQSLWQPSVQDYLKIQHQLNHSFVHMFLSGPIEFNSSISLNNWLLNQQHNKIISLNDTTESDMTTTPQELPKIKLDKFLYQVVFIMQTCCFDQNSIKPPQTHQHNTNHHNQAPFDSYWILQNIHHILDKILCDSMAIRYQFLSYFEIQNYKTKRQMYHYKTSNRMFTQYIIDIAKSLGWQTHFVDYNKSNLLNFTSNQNTNHTPKPHNFHLMFRPNPFSMSIQTDNNNQHNTKNNSSLLHIGQTFQFEIKKQDMAENDYYGFTVSGSNSRFLLSDFTVTHNTAAFALPILNQLSLDPFGIFAICLTPTRELAIQLMEQFHLFGQSIHVKLSLVIGGQSQMDQSKILNSLNNARPHIIIATPGRLAQLIQDSTTNDNDHSSIQTKHLQFLVMDEFDRLITDPSFSEPLETIFAVLPPVEQRQTLLFSATISSQDVKLVETRFGIKNAKFIQTKQCEKLIDSNMASTVEKLSQYYLFIPQHMKEIYLYYLIRDFLGLENENDTKQQQKHNKQKTKRSDANQSREDYQSKKSEQEIIKELIASSQHSQTKVYKQMIIFVSTCFGCQFLFEFLQLFGFSCETLHSRLSQRHRGAAIGKFKSQKVNILVCTDLSSRGLDIPNVSLVINYDVPKFHVDYVHRVGRVSRMGKIGKSITIVSQFDVEYFKKCEEYIDQKLPSYEFEINETDIYEPKQMKQILETKSIVSLKLEEYSIKQQKDNRGLTKVYQMTKQEKIAHDNKKILLTDDNHGHFKNPEYQTINKHVKKRKRQE